MGKISDIFNRYSTTVTSKIYLKPSKMRRKLNERVYCFDVIVWKNLLYLIDIAPRLNQKIYLKPSKTRNVMVWKNLTYLKDL